MEVIPMCAFQCFQKKKKKVTVPPPCSPRVTTDSCHTPEMEAEKKKKSESQLPQTIQLMQTQTQTHTLCHTHSSAFPGLMRLVILIKL